MKNMVIYLLGVLIVVGALAYGAHRLGVDLVWIGIGAAIIVGFGIMGAATKARPRN
ncbi:MAG: hypothetical protein ACT4PZ_02145 [Panacagrimonas sp.]